MISWAWLLSYRGKVSLVLLLVEILSNCSERNRLHSLIGTIISILEHIFRRLVKVGVETERRQWNSISRLCWLVISHRLFKISPIKDMLTIRVVSSCALTDQIDRFSRLFGTTRRVCGHFVRTLFSLILLISHRFSAFCNKGTFWFFRILYGISLLLKLFYARNSSVSCFLKFLKCSFFFFCIFYGWNRIKYGSILILSRPYSTQIEGCLFYACRMTLLKEFLSAQFLMAQITCEIICQKFESSQHLVLLIKVNRVRI